MDYSKLNNLLNDLEVKTKTQAQSNTDFNYQMYSETQKFGVKDETKEKKQKHTYENIAMNRNNEILELNGMNSRFNFERINPQRNQIQKPFNQTDNTSVELSRNLQTTNIHNLTDQRVVNVFDNTQFSENYKQYNDFKSNGGDDKSNSINIKLSAREQAPNLATVPKKMWDN
jgi:hypothetical protein